MTTASGFADPAFYADPYPLLDQLRTYAPVHRITAPDGTNLWLITRFEDATRVLKDSRFSASIERKTKDGIRLSPVSQRLLHRQMTVMDPPEHTRLRGLVSKAFSPRFIESLRPRVQEIADTLLDAMKPPGPIDLVSAFAFPLPIIVIAEMLGIPIEDRDRLREWSSVIFDAITRGANAEPAHLGKAEEFATYVHALIEEKRKSPGDDLISKLVEVEEGGSKLDDEELLSMIVLLIFAGHETTVNLIGNGMLALFSHPDEFAKLKRDPAQIPLAVEEMLRFWGSVLSTSPRVTTEEVEIGGQRIPKGEMIMVSLAAANHDPAQFEAPDRFDVTRAANKHLAFGHGIHFCLGAPLARVEVQIALESLLRRFPEIRLAVPREALRWRANLLLRGLHELPVML